jgi:type VI secretion system protein ImpG
MTDLARRFSQEMRSLLDEGAEFAKNFPEAARWLDSSLADNDDPYVDRLTEGVAFLTARIREEVPEDVLCEQLLEQYAPDLMQPLPSIAVVQFSLRAEAAHPVVLPPATPIGSEPYEGFPAPFEYRLHQPVAVDWAFVADARVDIDDSQSAQLILSLGWDDFGPTGAWPAALTIFLQGDLPVVWSLRHALLRRVATIELEANGAWMPAPDVRFERFDGICYTSDSGLVSPLATARDFFCADERFRFVRLAGLESTGIPLPNALRLRITFQGTIPPSWNRSVGNDTFLLHAGIAVNRFQETCEPLHLDHTRESYPLRSIGGRQREVLDAASVRGVSHTGSPSRQYSRYSDHRHDGRGWYFQTVRSRLQDFRMSIAVGTSNLREPPLEETLTVEAVCCDGMHPHERLRPEALNRIRPEISDLIQAQAITRPTRIYRPNDTAMHSRLLAFARVHSEGFLQAERLKGVLRQVLWDSGEAKRTLIESIRAVEVEHGTTLVNGIGWRLMRVQIGLRDTTCTPESWDRIGLLDAFGSILWGIVREEIPLGSKGELEMIVDPAGVRMKWS